MPLCPAALYMDYATSIRSTSWSTTTVDQSHVWLPAHAGAGCSSHPRAMVLVPVSCRTEMKAHIEKSGGNQRLSQLSYDLRRTEAQLTARQRQARLEREDAARREQRLSDAEQKELEAYRRSARDVLALTAPSPDHQPPAAWSQWNATASVSRASSVFSTPVGGAAGHPPRVTSSASARLSNRDRSASLRS